MSIGIVIPTFQAESHLPHCLPPLLRSPLKPRILVIDSSSTDETIPIAHTLGVETCVIPKEEFNHGLTREKGRKYLGTSIIVMITQDAYATSDEMLSLLVQPLIEQKASIAYARQIPHEEANLISSFHRHFNYPKTSHIRNLNDLPRYGAYTFFCSNSCAAYLNSALDEIGGFPSVSFGEDTIVTAKLLKRSHCIAYVAEAEVFHSHNYTLKQEFIRHLEIGFIRHCFQELFTTQKLVHQRGKRYFQSLIKELWKTSPALIPYAFFQTFAKFSGYHLGKMQSFFGSKNRPLA